MYVNIYSIVQLQSSSSRRDEKSHKSSKRDSDKKERDVKAELKEAKSSKKDKDKEVGQHLTVIRNHYISVE